MTDLNIAHEATRIALDAIARIRARHEADLDQLAALIADLRADTRSSQQVVAEIERVAKTD